MSSGSGGNNQQDPTFGMALGLIFIFGGLFGIYYAFKDNIHEGIMTIKMGQLYLIDWVTDAIVAPVFNWISATIPGITLPNYQGYYDTIISQTQNTDWSSLEWNQISFVANAVGQVIAPVIMLIFLVLGWWLMFKHPRASMRRRLSLTALMGFQSQKWSSISPIVKENPLEDKSGKWLEALNPEEWATRYGVDIEDGAPDREAARTAFSRQLSRAWTGVKPLPSYLQALFAAFALRGAKKNDDSAKILAMLAKGWSMHGSAQKALKRDPELAKLVKATLSDKKVMQPALEVARQHAWTETAMAAVVDWARANGGVMASADFLWLKAEDRAMWYVLNAVGRPSIFIESAGAIAHWRAEVVTKRPMPEPDVDEAVFGLEEYFSVNVPA